MRTSAAFSEVRGSLDDRLSATLAVSSISKSHEFPAHSDSRGRESRPRASLLCSSNGGYLGPILYAHWGWLTEAKVNAECTILNIDLLNQRHQLLLALDWLAAGPFLLQRCQGFLTQFAADLLRRGLAEGRLLLGEQFPVLRFCLIVFLVSLEELHA